MSAHFQIELFFICLIYFYFPSEGKYNPRFFLFAEFLSMVRTAQK